MASYDFDISYNPSKTHVFRKRRNDVVTSKDIINSVISDIETREEIPFYESDITIDDIVVNDWNFLRQIKKNDNAVSHEAYPRPLKSDFNYRGFFADLHAWSFIKEYTLLRVYNKELAKETEVFYKFHYNRITEEN